MTTLGLRIDVDTFRGTCEGVPRLLDLLAAHDVEASFFFSVGPDNMGRHLWRLVTPAFLAKMIRSRATRLYGWEVTLAGTCWPGRLIGAKLGSVIRAADNAGHEVGLHAWDHYRWQTRAGRMTAEELRTELGRGVDALGSLLGRTPSSSAAPGWLCNEAVLEAKETFAFRYNSDCRGHSLFQPVVHGRLCAPQVPTTLPTYDELIGRNGVTPDDYNERLLERIRPEHLNVLTVHAEVEGIACAGLFDAFLAAGRERGIRFVPLRSLLDGAPPLRPEPVALGPVPGRAGHVCWQRSALGPFRSCGDAPSASLGPY